MADNKKETKSRYPKSIRVIAMVGIILLLALYIITLIAALTTSPRQQDCLKPASEHLFCFRSYFGVIFVSQSY